MIDASGHARISGTGIKVQMLAVEYNMGRTSQEIRQAHKHLSLEQIEAALAYYRLHKAEFDAQIEAGNRLAEEMRAKTPTR
jgi:uncharacterized protein (DUF433 family)